MKSNLGRKKENLFWFVPAFLASAALLLSSLYWNAGSTVLSQATQPSKLYSLLVIAKSTTSLWLPTVIIMLGFLLEKQRGSLKDLVCQWVYLIFFGLLFLLIAMFGFQVYSLNN